MVCARCHEGEYNSHGKCNYCGAGNDRPVRYKRNRNIGGKRGRNSGSPSKGKQKRGTGH